MQNLNYIDLSVFFFECKYIEKKIAGIQTRRLVKATMRHYIRKILAENVKKLLVGGTIVCS